MEKMYLAGAFGGIPLYEQIKINLRKRIGRVVYFVEGDVTEIKLLKHILQLTC